jgi:hypothetical protein
MLARYYSSGLARFMAVDPIDGARPAIPMTWNKYVYVRNNPLALIDPDGRDPLNSIAVEYLRQSPPPSGAPGETALAIEGGAKKVSNFAKWIAAGSAVEALALFWLPPFSELLSATAATAGGVALAADGVAYLANPGSEENQKDLAIGAATAIGAGALGSAARAAGASEKFAKGIEVTTGAAVGATSVKIGCCEGEDSPNENESRPNRGSRMGGADDSRMPLTAKEERQRDIEAARD